MMPIIKALNHHRYFISAKREKEGKKKEKKIIKEFTPQPAVEEAGRGATSLTRPVKNCQVSNLGPLGAWATSGYPLRHPAPGSWNDKVIKYIIYPFFDFG